VTNPFYASQQAEQSKVILGEELAALAEAIPIGGWGTWARVGPDEPRHRSDRHPWVSWPRYAAGRRVPGVSPPGRNQLARHW
jgi:hypothetical protein